MRKFKIKNKPKRKYIKKQTAPINLSVSKSALISIFPLFFITLAVFFFVSVLMRSGAQAGPIVSQTIVQHVPHYAVPYIALPAVPKLSVMLPRISLPTVDSRPISNFVTKVTISFLGIMKDTFFRIVTFLDPRPLFSWIAHTRLFVREKLFAIGMTLAKGLAQTTIILAKTISTEIMLSYNLTLQTHERFTTLIFRGGQTIANALILSIHTISKIALQIGQTIIHEAERFGVSVQRETNKTVDVMKTPFRIMAYYLEQARPTFNKIGFILKRSVIELENNAVTIFTAPSKINE